MLDDFCADDKQNTDYLNKKHNLAPAPGFLSEIFI